MASPAVPDDEVPSSWRAAIAADDVLSRFAFLLGSSSRFRQRIFREYFPVALPDFHTSADIDEKAIRHAVPEVMTQRIARAKAERLLAVNEGVFRRYFADTASTGDARSRSRSRSMGRSGRSEDNHVAGDGARSRSRSTGGKRGAPAPVFMLCLDQVVRFRGEVREKPESETQARIFLDSYRDNPDDWVECVNGICVCYMTASGAPVARRRKQAGDADVSAASGSAEQPNAGDFQGTIRTGVEISKHRCTKLTPAIIDRLLREGNCLHTAGSFVIEDMGDADPKLMGTMDAICGLPVSAILDLCAKTVSGAAAFPDEEVGAEAATLDVSVEEWLARRREASASAQ